MPRAHRGRVRPSANDSRRARRRSASARARRHESRQRRSAPCRCAGCVRRSPPRHARSRRARVRDRHRRRHQSAPTRAPSRAISDRLVRPLAARSDEKRLAVLRFSGPRERPALRHEVGIESADDDDVRMWACGGALIMTEMARSHRGAGLLEELTTGCRLHREDATAPTKSFRKTFLCSSVSVVRGRDRWSFRILQNTRNVPLTSFDTTAAACRSGSSSLDDERPSGPRSPAAAVSGARRTCGC